MGWLGNAQSSSTTDLPLLGASASSAAPLQERPGPLGRGVKAVRSFPVARLVKLVPAFIVACLVYLYVSVHKPSWAQSQPADWTGHASTTTTSPSNFGGFSSSDISANASLSSSSSVFSASKRPNTGWMSFDERVDSPFVKRYTNTAPPTGRELLFTDECRDAWIADLRLCPQLKPGYFSKSPLAQTHQLDMVYTWQNGSDPLQIAARREAMQDTSKGDSGTGAHHFRDHDELRHSLRAVFKSFRRFPEAIKRVFLYTSDLHAPDTDHQRLGAIPKWLDVRHPNHLLTKLQPVFPWQTFKTPAADSYQQAVEWRQQALPTFQSMAVETQFPNIDFDEWMVYSCDDFFLLGDLSPSDLYTPLFGPNFRLRTFHATYPPTDPERYQGSRIAEGLSLTNSAWVLGKRFGMRHHRYIEHVHKIYNKPLLQEMQSAFAEELADGASVKLRGRGPDINIHSLFIHFTIERHREALLWSVIVAKADKDGDGFLNLEEWQELLLSLGATPDRSTITVPQPRRKVDTSLVLKEAGLEQPLHTKFNYISSNGYALMLAANQNMGVHGFPQLDRPGQSRFCSISLSQCFGSPWSRAPEQSTSDLMKRVAFQHYRCGDCISAALLGHASSGLEAFLPPRGLHETAMNKEGAGTDYIAGEVETPVLPLTKHWEDTDFSLNNVMPTHVDARDFVTRLLLRYSYTMATSKSRLVLLHNEFEARFELGRLKPDVGLDKVTVSNPSFLGINDDIEQDEEEIQTMLNGWFKMQWPDQLDWEV